MLGLKRKKKKENPPCVPLLERGELNEALLEKGGKNVLPDREAILDALREVYDPEIPVNIYDLGLIYDVIIQDTGHVDINMTLTTPGCPVAQTFPGTVESAVNHVEHVDDCTVTLVWEPPWTQDLMTEAAKLQLGLL